MVEEARWPHHDVARINAALVDTAYGLFRADNAKLRENLTAQEMSDASAAAARATQPDDMLLIFYSGHGERRGTRRELGLLGVDVQLNRIESRGHDRPARRPRRNRVPRWRVLPAQTETSAAPQMRPTTRATGSPSDIFTRSILDNSA